MSKPTYEELAAQVEALKQIAYLADGARVEAADGNGGEEKRWLHKLYCAVGEYDCTATPAACLASVQAEAFVRGAVWESNRTKSGVVTIEDVREVARSLYSRIRQGGDV